MRTTHQRPRKRRGHETQRVDRTARPRGSRSWPQAPRLSAIARRWLLGPRLKSCPQGQLKHRRYSLPGALANSRTCFPRSTAIAPCPLTDQRHTAGLARPGDPHRGAGRPRPPDLPADRDWSPRTTGVDAPGRRSARTGLAPGWPAGLAALNCHAFRLAATELQRRHRPRGHSPAAPTAPPELRRAVELAPMRCPIQPRRRCPPLRGNGRREQHGARRPISRRPNGQDRPCSHTRQDGAQAELADDADARTAAVEQEQRAPRCSLPMRGGGATPR
jgi:hypothetical protein